MNYFYINTMSTEIWNSTMNELITEISCSDDPVYISSRILIIALTNIIGEEAFLDDQLKNIWLVICYEIGIIWEDLKKTISEPVAQAIDYSLRGIMHEPNLNPEKIILEMGSTIIQKWGLWKSECGEMMLHKVVEKGYTIAVKLLLKAGLDKDLKTVDGDTPLLYAVYNKNIDIIKLLLDVGVDKDVKNNDGDTPLLYAVCNQNIEIIKLLLDVGVDKDIKDKKGMTPLHYAVLTDNIEIVKILLDAGVNMNIKENYGYTPLNVALINDRTEISKLLQDKL